MAHLFQSLKVVIEKTNIPQNLPDFHVLKVNAIKAHKNNSGIVYIGGHEVESGLSSGFPLEVGEAVTDIETELLGEIFISGTKGDIVNILVTDNPILRNLQDVLTHNTLGDKNHINPHI